MTVKRTFAVAIVTFLLLIILAEATRTTQVSSQDVQPEMPMGELPADFAENMPEDFANFLAQQQGLTTQATSGISALGSVEAKAVVALSFQTGGTVEGVYVQTGDYVEAGEVLADLNATSTWETYHQALLNLESAQISMDDLLAPPTDAELAVARANITSAQAAYSASANPMSEEQRQVAQMQYDQQVQQLEALRLQRAYSGGSEEQIALLEAQVGAATFNTEISRLQLEEQLTPDSTSLWSASLRIQQAQLELEKLQAEPTEAEITSAQLSIDRAQVSVLNAQNALLQTQLVAPRSGYVLAVNIEPGQSVTSQTSVIQIADLSELQMTVPVNELDIGLVKPGLNATIELDALPGVEIAGTVQNVGWLSQTSSDGIVTYDVRILLNTSDSRILTGMSGEVVIDTGSTVE